MYPNPDEFYESYPRQHSYSYTLPLQSYNYTPTATPLWPTRVPSSNRLVSKDQEPNDKGVHTNLAKLAVIPLCGLLDEFLVLGHLLGVGE